MHLIGILIICCLSLLTMADDLHHGKIVSCLIVAQSILDAENNDFQYNETYWKMCTHLTVIDSEFYYRKGNTNQFFFLIELKIV